MKNGTTDFKCSLKNLKYEYIRFKNKKIENIGTKGKASRSKIKYFQKKNVIHHTCDMSTYFIIIFDLHFPCSYHYCCHFCFSYVFFLLLLFSFSNQVKPFAACLSKRNLYIWSIYDTAGGTRSKINNITEKFFF